MLRVTLILFLTTAFTICVHGGPVTGRFESLFEPYMYNHTSTYLYRRDNRVPTGRHIIRALHAQVNIHALLQQKGLHFLEPIPIPLVDGLVGEFDEASKTKLPAVMNTVADQIKLYVEYEVRTMVDQRNAPWGISRVWSGHTLNSDDMAVKKPHKGDKSLVWDFRYEESAGECATIYIIDSGIDLSHSEFTGRVEWSATFVKKGKAAEKKLDLLGHGTEVASIAAGTQFGIAKKAKWVSVKVGNKERVRGGDVILGMDHVAQQRDKHPDSHMVVNLSVGTEEPCELTDLAAKKLVAKGIYVVAAAGNDGKPASAHSPGRVPEVITVGASTVEDKIWEKSGHGPLVDIFAPGVQVPAATIGGPKKNTMLKPGSGTSLAAPHVSGLIAYLGCLKHNPVRDRPEKMAERLREFAMKATSPQLKDAPADTHNHFILHMPPPQK